MTKRESTFTVQFCERHEKASREVVAGRGFHLNESSLIDFFWSVPSARQIDLLRHGNVGLRHRPPCAAEEEDRWTPVAPVSAELRLGYWEPNFWNSDEVREALVDCLDFVSGDSWDFGFNGNSTPIEVDKQRFLPLFDDPPLLCLYSGGLDSAAGLSSRIAECPGRPVIPITVWHQPRQKKLICEKHTCMLKERFGVLLTPVVAKAAMIWSSELRKSKRKNEANRSR